MPKFKYVAITAEGLEVNGSLDSITSGTARGMLVERALSIVSLKEQKSLLKFEVTKKKVPKALIMQFSRQLSAFIKAGIPILEAIDIFADETDNKVFRIALTEIADALRGGEHFSTAVGAQGHVFPRFYVDMLNAAELTGRLDSVLNQLSTYMERDLLARQRIKSALAYPVIIGGMSVVTVLILAVFVLPRFQVFFKSLNAKLPLPTRIVLAGSGFVGTYWWAIAGGMGVFAAVVIPSLKTERGRRFKSRLVLKLPVIREVTHYSIVERFCRILSSMVVAGVPLPDAMIVVSEATRNTVYQKALDKVRLEMLEGEGIAAPITRTQLFPTAVTQMVRVGEATGTLDAQLATAAAYYEQELDYKVKKLTALFEPMMIIAMGAVVGFVAIALVSAMYGVFNQSKGGA
jgi:type IV pilus assembly protein PilC